MNVLKNRHVLVAALVAPLRHAGKDLGVLAVARLREFCGDFPGLKATIDPLPLGPPAANPVEVRISGRDPDVVFGLVDRTQEKLAGIAGTRSISDNWGARSKKILVRIDEARAKLEKAGTPEALSLIKAIDAMARKSVWIVGGDGWAYDIGFGGLDHVLASGRNVNVLVMDTEVYSNTGGQMSKATPLGASAKFASAGKRIGKKDLALQAISYGNVYVAQVAMGANPQQTLLAMREAEEYEGPSLILAYSHCIAHGYDLRNGLNQQKLATESGYWPLIRYNPALRSVGTRPFVLDSPRPKIPLEEYIYNENRYRILKRTNPEEAAALLKSAQELVEMRWQTYVHMSKQEPAKFQPAAAEI